MKEVKMPMKELRQLISQPEMSVEQKDFSVYLLKKGKKIADISHSISCSSMESICKVLYF